MVRKPKGYWHLIENVLKELEPLLNELGRIPTQQEIIVRGLNSLNTNVSKYHSGKKISEITGYIILNPKNHGIKKMS